jgi:hypothetical protein
MTDALSWANPYFGVEIEAEAPQDHGAGTKLITSEMPDGLFAAKSDGSLHHGAEFVSQPLTLRYAQAIDWSPFDELRQLGWRAWDTTTAGFHIHISRVAFHIPTGYVASNLPSLKRYSRRQQQWIASQERSIAYTVERRNNQTRYLAEYRLQPYPEYYIRPMNECRRVRTQCNHELREMRRCLENGPPIGMDYDDEQPIRVASQQSDAHLFRFGHLILSSPAFFQRLAGRDSERWADFKAQPKSSFKGTTLKPHNGSRLGRYVPVNLSNRNTVEVRIFRGTIRPKRILANLELVAGAVEYTRNLKTGDVASGALQYRSLVTWLNERNATYPHICELLADSKTLLRLERGDPLRADSPVQGYETKETANETEVIPCVF